jgi:hypothetical protein
LKSLPDGCDDAGSYSLLRVIASFPARADVSNEKNWKENGDPPIATLNMELVKEVTKGLSPLNILEKREQAWMESNDRVSKKRRGSDVAECGEKRRKMVKREEDSDASECSSRKSVDSQKRERDAGDENSDSREKRRKTLDVQDKLDAAKGRKRSHIKNLIPISLNRVL